MLCCCFFFSSRRRHTRWTGDWSSDVCSSDLRDTVASKIVNQGIVDSMRQVVVILDADDFAYSAPFHDLCGGDVAQPDVTHPSLPLKVGESGQRRLDRALRGSMDIEHAPKVHDLEHIQAQVAQT